jgi:hypothetical protein
VKIAGLPVQLRNTPANAPLFVAISSLVAYWSAIEPDVALPT